MQLPRCVRVATVGGLVVGVGEDRVRDGDEIIVSERPSKCHKSNARGRAYTHTHAHTNSNFRQTCYIIAQFLPLVFGSARAAPKMTRVRMCAAQTG